MPKFIIFGVELKMWSPKMRRQKEERERPLWVTQLSRDGPTPHAATTSKGMLAMLDEISNKIL